MRSHLLSVLSPSHDSSPQQEYLGRATICLPPRVGINLSFSSLFSALLLPPTPLEAPSPSPTAAAPAMAAAQ
jgi:hypothetical protein